MFCIPVCGSVKYEPTSLSPAFSIIFDKVLYILVILTIGPAGEPCSLIASTCCLSIWFNIPSCWSLEPVPNPTWIDTLQRSLHSIGFIGTKLFLIFTIRSLSWYLTTSSNIFLNISLTPVSAKIRAINSILICDCERIVLIPDAVLFNESVSIPWLYLVTPLRFSFTVSKYSNNGNAWLLIVCVCIGIITCPGAVLVLTIPPGRLVNRSSRLTWPSITVDLINCISSTSSDTDLP